MRIATLLAVLKEYDKAKTAKHVKHVAISILVGALVPFHSSLKDPRGIQKLKEMCGYSHRRHSYIDPNQHIPEESLYELLTIILRLDYVASHIGLDSSVFFDEGFYATQFPRHKRLEEWQHETYLEALPNHGLLEGLNRRLLIEELGKERFYVLTTLHEKGLLTPDTFYATLINHPVNPKHAQRFLSGVTLFRKESRKDKSSPPQVVTASLGMSRAEI